MIVVPKSCNSVVGSPQVDIAGQNLPDRAIAQFDDVAFRTVFRREERIRTSPFACLSRLSTIVTLGAAANETGRSDASTAWSSLARGEDPTFIRLVNAATPYGLSRLPFVTALGAPLVFFEIFPLPSGGWIGRRGCTDRKPSNVACFGYRFSRGS